jgi:hypothetical protein
VFLGHETTSELESHDLVDPIICRCRKHQQFTRYVGGFVACFPLNISMVYSPKPTIITDGNNLIHVKFARGETISFGGMEFITDRFDNLSFSPEGNASGAIVVGMVHSGSPSLHAILKESTSEDDLASRDEGISGFPISQGCNVVSPIVPITTTPLSEGTSVCHHPNGPIRRTNNVFSKLTPSAGPRTASPCSRQSKP